MGSRIALDSGATANIFKESCSNGFINIREDTSFRILTPSGHIIRSIKVGEINNPEFPPEARRVIIFKDDDLPNFNLVSVRLFTNAGMKATFSKDHAVIANVAGKELVRAPYNVDSRLYLMEDTRMEYGGVMFPKSSTMSEKARFYIAADHYHHHRGDQEWLAGVPWSYKGDAQGSSAL